MASTSMIRAWAALCGLLLLGPAAARAEEGAVPVEMPRQARLLLPSCPASPFVADDLISILRVELLGHGTELGHITVAGDGAPADAAVISVDLPYCDGSDIRVRLDHPTSGQRVTQRLDFADTPVAERARVLALAIAELLIGSWGGLNAPPSPPPEPPPSPPAQRPAPELDVDAIGAAIREDVLEELDRRRAAAQVEPPRVLLAVALGAELFPFGEGGLFGPGLGLSLRLSRAVPMRLAIDLAYRYGEASTSVGKVRDHVALGALSLLFEGGNGALRGHLGPGLEFGWGWVATEPPDPDAVGVSFNGPLLSVALNCGLSLRLGRVVSLSLASQVGYVLVGLVPLESDRRIAGINGMVVGFDIGMIFVL